MSAFNRALFVINEVYADEYVKQHMTPLEVTKALADAGLLAPEPRVIRTRAELAALDPDTLVFDAATDAAMFPMELDAYEDALPAVVIATGDQTRSARQALKEGE